MHEFINTYWIKSSKLENHSLRKSLKFIVLFLFAVFLLWFFGRNLDWAEVGMRLRGANAFYIAAAFLIICLGYFLRALRWKVLLAPITETSLKELFATTTVGFAAVFFVGRAGEIVRPMWLPMRDKRVRPSAALVTLGVERIFDLAALICFFSITLLWFAPTPGHEKEFANIKVVGNLLLVGVAFGFLSLYIYQKFAPRIIDWTEKATDKRFVPRRLRKLFLSLLRQLAASLRILKDWREIVSVVFWTTMLWLSIAIPTWLVILAFNLNVGVSLSGAMFVMFCASMGSLIPTPGGAAGAFHAVTAYSLGLLGINASDAAAISIVMHLVYFAPALLFGFYYLFHGDISIARFRSLLSSEHAVEEIEEGETAAAAKMRKGEKEREAIADRESQIENV